MGGDAFVFEGAAGNLFYQLNAEWSGDRGVSIFDFSPFSYWFGQEFPDAPLYMDLNNDGGVSIFDFAAFTANFGASVVNQPGLAARPGTSVDDRVPPNALVAVERDERRKTALKSTHVAPQTATAHDIALQELAHLWSWDEARTDREKF